MRLLAQLELQAASLFTATKLMPFAFAFRGFKACGSNKVD